MFALGNTIVQEFTVPLGKECRYNYVHQRPGWGYYCSCCCRGMVFPCPETSVGSFSEQTVHNYAFVGHDAQSSLPYWSRHHSGWTLWNLGEVVNCSEVMLYQRSKIVSLLWVTPSSHLLAYVRTYVCKYIIVVDKWTNPQENTVIIQDGVGGGGGWKGKGRREILWDYVWLNFLVFMVSLTKCRMRGLYSLSLLIKIISKLLQLHFNQACCVWAPLASV